MVCVEMKNASNQKAETRVSLAHKLFAGILGAGLVAAIAVGAGAYWVAADIVETDAYAQLEASEVGHNHSLKIYFESVEADLAFLSTSGMGREGLLDFGAGWKGQASSALQRAYIDENPHPLGSKHLLDVAEGSSGYNAAHARFHPSFRKLLEARGYYDIFLISNAGDIIYSVFKERDFATNLLNGEYADSGLGEAFRKAKNGDARSFVDFAPYAPSHGAPAAFVATPVTSAKGDLLGVVALQIPSDRIANALNTGDGLTSYAVGADGVLRSDLAETEESDILARQVSGTWLSKVLASDHVEVMEGQGVLGAPSVISAAPIDALGETWIVVAEKSRAEAYQPLHELLTAVLMVMAPIMLGVGALALFLGRSLSASIQKLGQAMNRVAEGRLDEEIPGVSRSDEVGDMARSLEVFRRNAGVQLAITAAMESNRAPIVIIDGQGDEITRNPAFAALWERIEGEFSEFAATMDGNLNLASLVRRVEQLEATGDSVKVKADGDHAIDLTHGDVILEIKRTAVVDSFGRTVGQSLQILDVSNVRRLENELLKVITKVEEGDFSMRVNALDNMGFTSIAAAGLNALMRNIGAFMSELDDALDALAKGDLTRRIEKSFKGKFEHSREQYNASVSSLCDTFAGARAAAEIVGRDIQPIADGAGELAARAESQASTLEQTAATMEEMTANIKSNAERAVQASEISRRACEMAEQGGAVVDDTVGAMRRIEESSSKIGDIISVIEAIAFQTNLLALNAAVEAARAGEAGKGFAVVASEVRSLAQRSSEAARDIKDLIETGSSHVHEGSVLVSRTGESLTGLVGQIQDVARLISEITVAVREQSIGVEEITASVSQLDEMTQHNATMADISAQSANSLRSVSSELTQAMAAFRTGDAALATAPAAPIETASREGELDTAWSEAEDAAPVAGPVAAPVATTRPTGGGDWAEF